MERSDPSDPFDRGHVVWHDGLFHGSGRPWLVVSDTQHPFLGEEYVVAGLTTAERPNAIELGDEDWVVGGLPRKSYVSPWFLTTLEHAAIERGVGTITTETVDAVAAGLDRYLP